MSRALPCSSSLRYAGWVAGASVTLALFLGGCSSGAAPSSTSSPGQVPVSLYEVSTSTLAGVGKVLTNGSGLTLYLFKPDHRSTPTCTGSCAAAWRPYFLPPTVTEPKAGPGVKASLLGAVRIGSSRQVTYNGWPLYRWVGDIRPGVDTGQARSQFGGYWYVVSPAGDAVTR